ncbi:MAG TPA: hypothetical protein VF618_00250 [Thermoanaerobaculia bacterium]
MRPRLRLALEALYVLLLSAAAWLLVADHARGDSITIDETLHIFAGAEYVQHGTYVTNPEHPPLTKDLAGLALLPLRLQPPRIVAIGPLPPVEELTRFYTTNHAPLRTIVAAARTPFRWLLVLLIAVVYVAARTAWGVPAAMLASALIALDPNFIAHAGLVHTDVAAALFMTLATVLAVAGRWPWAGVALGLALLAKFSALILVPLMVAAPFLGRERMGRIGRTALMGVMAVAIAAVIVLLGYAANLRSMPATLAAQSVTNFLRVRDVPHVERYAALTEAVPQAGMFAAGVRGVQQSSAHGQSWNYLRGKLSREGFPHYFFIAFLVKSTPAMLLVTLAIFFGGRLLRSPWALGLLAPAALLLAVSLPSSFNIGIRHILPIYPLLAITGAGVLAARLPRRAFVVAATLLIASAAVSAGTSHPHELAYFNAIARGDGAAWLSDSNLDWGQDVDRLQTLLRERGWERDTAVVVLSSPALWPELARYPPRANRVAISAYMEQIGARELTADLRRRGRKVATAGASISVWELGLPHHQNRPDDGQRNPD